MLSCLISSFFLLPCRESSICSVAVPLSAVIWCRLSSSLFLFFRRSFSMCLFLSILLSLFLYPRSDLLLVSVSTWLKLSMFISCFSCSTWKRFFNSSLKAFSVLNSLVLLCQIAVVSLLLVLSFVVLRTVLPPPTHDRFLCRPHDLL